MFCTSRGVQITPLIIYMLGWFFKYRQRYLLKHIHTIYLIFQSDSFIQSKMFWMTIEVISGVKNNDNFYGVSILLV